MTLAAKGVGYAYGPRPPVLGGVDLEVRPGEVTTVVGPNGAGKTTLLRCLAGSLAPTQGTVTLLGQPLGTYGRVERARRLAYVPQSPAGQFPITVFDRVLLGRRPYLGWRPDRHDLEVVARTIVELRLEDFAGRDLGQLSGGERQRVLVAAAVAQETEVILLDEPTTHLDLEHQLDLMDLVRQLAADRRTAVLQTMHDLNLALGISDRIAVIDSGRLVATGPPAIIDAALVRDVYGVDCDVIDHDGRRVLIPRTRGDGVTPR